MRALMLCFLISFLSCIHPKEPEPGIAKFFPVIPAKDTLHVEISEEGEATVSADTIPNALFFSEIPASLLKEIDYLADSAEALVLGRGRITLDAALDGYWVEIQQFWFKHHSLLLYDTRLRQFTQRVTLAEFYGGEGGQVLLGSWIFDYDGDGDKDILRREIQHATIPVADSVDVRTAESAALLLWKNRKFVDAPLKDTLEAVRRYPIRSLFE